jgi:hypothetical protein
MPWPKRSATRSVCFVSVDRNQRRCCVNTTPFDSASFRDLVVSPVGTCGCGCINWPLHMMGPPLAFPCCLTGGRFLSFRRIMPNCGGRQPMRWIVGIAAMLLCLGWVACQIELVSANVQQPRPDDGWRRTTIGWERLAPIQKSSRPQPEFWWSHPHPLTATLLLVMLSLLLLVAFTDPAAWQNTPSPANSAAKILRPAAE